MLYEYLSGEVEAWHIAPRFSELSTKATLFWIPDESSIDLKAPTRFRSKTRIRWNFDVLVLAVGGVTNYVGVEGAEQHFIPVSQAPAR